MPVVEKKYCEIRDCMKPGDVIAFSGKKALSETIKWATRSNVSHVGVVLQYRLIVDGKPEGRVFNQVAEATDSGVKIVNLSGKQQAYEGEMWWLPLSGESRGRLNFNNFSGFLIDSEGAPYDSLPTLFKSWQDDLDVLPDVLPDFLEITRNKEDFEAFFCSELVAGALEKGGVIENVNASEVTPIDLCRFNIYKKYVQFKGEEKKIRGFNSVDPTNWGQ